MRAHKHTNHQPSIQAASQASQSVSQSVNGTNVEPLPCAENKKATSIGYGKRYEM